MASPRRPLTGLRLTYEITMGGYKYRVRVKESVGTLLGLKLAPAGQTGVFGASGLPVIPGLGGGNIGKKFLKSPGGFRFQSYKFLVVPGTTVREPVPGCNSGTTRQRQICSFSLGFARGPKEARISRWRVESWARSKSIIIGMITPSGTQHIWKGKMSNNPLGGITGGLGGITGGLPDLGNLPDLLQQGGDILKVLGPLL